MLSLGFFFLLVTIFFLYMCDQYKLERFLFSRSIVQEMVLWIHSLYDISLTFYKLFLICFPSKTKNVYIQTKSFLISFTHFRCFFASVQYNAGGRWHPVILYGISFRTTQSKRCYYMLGTFGSVIQR